MQTQAVTDVERQGVTASAFWWRLCDNAFRRGAWLLIPVVVFASLGTWQASRTTELYRSGGLLSASSNPLLPETQIGGVAQQTYWETPAMAASRTVNEQLRTDVFVEGIAERAGLGGQLESGTIELADVRSAIWSSADGTSLVHIDAAWSDPQTAFGLVDSTILAYQEFLAESVASQSAEAETFFRDRLLGYQDEVATAQSAVEEFLIEFGDIPSESRPLTVELELTRLTNALDAAQNNATDVQSKIDEAVLNVQQSRSEAGRSLTLIDEPKVPNAPQSTLVKRASIIVSLTLLGVVIMLAALFTGTVLDKSVASALDLRNIRGVEHVATVPKVRIERPLVRPHRRRRRERPAPTQQREKVGV